MTVSSETRRIDYITSAGLLAYPVPFRFLDAAHLAVYLAGVRLTLVTDYTVSGAGNPAGTVTLTADPGAGAALAIVRDVPLTQETDYVQHDAFPAETHEAALDKLTMIAQQQQEALDRSLKLATSSTYDAPVLPDPVVGRVLEWSGTTPPTLRNTLPAVTGISVPISTVNGGTGVNTSAVTGLPTVRGGAWVFQDGDGAVTIRDGVWYYRGDFINVKEFGATGNGVADDSAAIQAAIDALPATGGTVYFPAGTYRISATLTIGNGVSDTASTRYGVRLVGVAPADLGDYCLAATRLVWGGALAGTMLQVAGPLRGFEMHNVRVDGASLANYGLFVVSAGNVRLSGLTFVGCRTAGIHASCHASTPVFSKNCDSWECGNITVVVPDIAQASGVILHGAADGSSSTCFTAWTNLRIILTGDTQPTYGLVLRVADANRFESPLIMSHGVVAGRYGVVFDYSVSNTFPSQCTFDSPDVGWNLPPAAQWVNDGVPGLARAHTIAALGEVNGAYYPVGLANVESDLPKQDSRRVAIINGTGAVGGTTLLSTTVSRLYRITYYLCLSVPGAGGTIYITPSWNDGIGGKWVTSAPLPAAVANGFVQGSVFAVVGANQQIAYTITFDSVTGSPAYTAFLCAERMS